MGSEYEGSKSNLCTIRNLVCSDSRFQVIHKLDSEPSHLEPICCNNNK